MLLMVEKGIRGGIHHAIHQYAKTNNNYKNDFEKNEESLHRLLHLSIWMFNATSWS